MSSPATPASSAWRVDPPPIPIRSARTRLFFFSRLGISICGTFFFMRFFFSHINVLECLISYMHAAAPVAHSSPRVAVAVRTHSLIAYPPAGCHRAAVPIEVRGSLGFAFLPKRPTPSL